MTSHRITFAVIGLLVLAVASVGIIQFRVVAAAVTAPLSSDTGALVAAASVASETSSIATSTATSTPVQTTSVLSEFNKLSISGQCIVTRSINQKRCTMTVTYTSPTGVPVVDVPVTISTLEGEGTFTNIDAKRVIKNGPGRVEQLSANLGGNVEAAASFEIPATATSSTWFIARTRDGLRAQSQFIDTTTEL